MNETIEYWSKNQNWLETKAQTSDSAIGEYFFGLVVPSAYFSVGQLIIYLFIYLSHLSTLEQQKTIEEVMTKY